MIFFSWYYIWQIFLWHICIPITQYSKLMLTNVIKKTYDYFLVWWFSEGFGAKSWEREREREREREELDMS